jgi:hypothetical protein
METVNVQALSSTFGSGTLLNSTISWNFGDPGSEYNTLVGFNAAHAYATAGTYTVTLTITTPDGHVGVATQTVTVSADNRTTIYVSPNGSDSNNGSSASQAIQSIDRLNQLIGSNTRVLFEDGGTYDVSDQAINVAGLSHVYVGTYGSGAAPVLMYTGSSLGSLFNFSASSQSITVDGLAINTVYSAGGGDDCDGIDPMGNDIAIIGVNFNNIENAMNMNSGPSNVLIQDDSTLYQSGMDGYFTWIQGNDIVLLGNTIANSISQADLRIGGANDVEIAYNDFGKTTSTGDSYKNCMTIQNGQYAYIYQNTTTNGPLLVGPIGDPGSDTSASFQDVVIDSNTMNDDDVLINPNSIDVMVKNNVINQDNAYGIVVNSTEIGGGFNWQVQNLWLENNTVTEDGGGGGFIAIYNGDSQNIVMDNNVFDCPGLQVGNDGGVFVYDTNNTLQSFSEIKDNVWQTPASANSWYDGGEFYVDANPGEQQGYLTPAQWEQMTLSSGENPTGDVYENVQLGSTYSVTADGFTAGSNLPNS